jgi:hypothetical protein
VPRNNIHRSDINNFAEDLLAGKETSQDIITNKHEPYIYLIDFSLVATHYHLYVVVNKEDSIPDFMKRLNTGFAKFFNLKYKRKGALFGSRYKSVRVKSDFQSDAVSRYVNIVNPLDIYQPGWREKGLNDIGGAMSFLENYKFSSFPDRIGKRNSLIVAPEEEIKDYLPENSLNEEEYVSFAKDFLEQRAWNDDNFIRLE